MRSSVTAEQQLGITELRTLLAKCGLEILVRDPWPNQESTYFEIGKPDQRSSVLLSDEFIRDLPKTPEYKAAVESYAAALAGRIRCGSPDIFYCLSNTAIVVAVTWPIQAAVHNGTFSAWMLINVTKMGDGRLAKCCLNIAGMSGYSRNTMLDSVRNATSRIRRAIDQGTVSFYDPRSHPDTYQRINEDTRESHSPITRLEVEKFIAGKIYMLAFQLNEVPGEAWVADPWDAEYLGITKKDLFQAAYVLKARGLIELDTTLSFARPSDKLLTEGWPNALESATTVPARQIFELARLPKKEALLTELRDALTQHLGIAVIVIDLDKFKEVNDTKGHPEGDRCLENLVKAIGGALGRKGTLYRWGGDEFAISLLDFSTDEAMGTAQRIRRTIEEAKAGGDIAVTASVGLCATDRLQDPQAEMLLESADKAMYASKKNGKNRVTTWPIE
jgi:diguanylate cyclase (GGDEF)-like protein